MSGRRITDMGGMPHTSKMAMKSKNHVKNYHSSEGSGHIGMEYHDTTEGIQEDQNHGDRKIKAHKMKPGYRH